MPDLAKLRRVEKSVEVWWVGEDRGSQVQRVYKYWVGGS